MPTVRVIRQIRQHLSKIIGRHLQQLLWMVGWSCMKKLRNNEKFPTKVNFLLFLLSSETLCNYIWKTAFLEELAALEYFKISIVKPIYSEQIFLFTRRSHFNQHLVCIPSCSKNYFTTYFDSSVSFVTISSKNEMKVKKMFHPITRYSKA